jgi:phage-related minor tail protein
MVDKITAQRDVEYFYELLAKETDENRRVILQRLLADAEKRRQAEDQEENSNKKTNADQADRKDN